MARGSVSNGADGEGGGGVVLCIINIKLLDTRFAYLQWTVFSVVYSVFFVAL
jgi:hypothetical protein